MAHTLWDERKGSVESIGRSIGSINQKTSLSHQSLAGQPSLAEWLARTPFVSHGQPVEVDIGVAGAQGAKVLVLGVGWPLCLALEFKCTKGETPRAVTLPASAIAALNEHHKRQDEYRLSSERTIPTST